MSEKVRNLPVGHGLNAATNEYVDLIAEGIIDPAKVTRSALQNAASIAALFLTTEAVIADKPEKASAPRPAACRAVTWTSDPPGSVVHRSTAVLLNVTEGGTPRLGVPPSGVVTGIGGSAHVDVVAARPRPGC